MTSENPIEEHKAANRANPEAPDKSETTSQFLPSTGIPKVEIPPSPYTHQITCKTEKDWRDKVKFWAELVGLGVLLAYTIFTALMYCANKKAADAAKQAADAATQQSKTSSKQLEISERAWIKVTFEGDIPTNINGPLLLPFQFQNTGHTPAVKPHGVIVVKLLESTEPLLIGPEYKYPMVGVSFGDIFQGEMKSIQVPLMTGGPGNVKPAQVTAPILRQIIRHELHIVGFGNLLYDDVFGHSHWIKFCTVGSEGKPGSFEAQKTKIPFTGDERCIEYNDIDKP